MLQTVITLRSVPLPPWFLTRSTSHSPPHLDISLFLPTSSASIFFASEISSCAMVSTFLPASISVWSLLESRRVAAPRLTAVGRAVYRCARIASICCLKVFVVSNHSGDGEVARERVR